MKRCFLLLLFSSRALSADLSLSDIFAKVEKQNIEIRAGREQIKVSESAYEAAAAKFYPKLDLETRFTHLNDDIELGLDPIRSAIIASGQAAAGATGGPQVGAAVAAGLNNAFPPFSLQVQKQDYFNAALTLTQPLYAGGKISANEDAKFHDWKASEIQSEDTGDRLMVSAAQAYYGVQLSERALAVRKELRDGLSTHQAISEKLLAEGQLTKVAKMNGDVKLAEAESNLQKARHDLELAWAILGNLINEKVEGAMLTTVLKMEDSVEPLAQYANQASTQNKSLKVVDHRLEQLNAKYAATRADHLPSVFAFGRYELYKEDLTATEPDWYVGIGLKMNLFSGGEIRHNLNAVHAEQATAQAMREVAQQSIDLAVQKTYSDLLSARDQYRALNSAVTLAEKSVEMNSASYRNGVVRSIDVTDAYSTLASVKLAHLKALYDYNMALFQLKRLTGTLSRGKA